MHRLITFILSICFFITAIELSYSQTDTEKANDGLIEIREKEVKEVEKILNLRKKDLINNTIMPLSKIDKGIARIKQGDGNFLKKITYIKYRLFLRGVNIYAQALKVHPVEILSIDDKFDTANRLNNTKRNDNIIKALIGGIKNKDPRVRLSISYFLKEIEFDYYIEEKLFKIFKEETVETGYYVFVDPELNVSEANPQFEVALIQKYLERKRLTLLIKRNVLKPSDMSNIKRYFFILLTERIANEPSNEIPLISFGAKKIDYFIAGLFNKDSYIKGKCAEHIYLLFPKLNSKKQKEIKKLIDRFYVLKLIFRQKSRERYE